MTNYLKYSTDLLWTVNNIAYSALLDMPAEISYIPYICIGPLDQKSDVSQRKWMIEKAKVKYT